MSDNDPLKRLLDSPLDVKAKDVPKAKKPPRSERKRRATEPEGDGGSRVAFPVVGLAAALVGAAIVVGAYLVAGSSDDTPPVTVAQTAPTTEAPVAVEPVAGLGDLPEGYVGVNDLVGIRPERVLLREGTLFVSFSQVVRSRLDPDQTSAFGGGTWVLELADGTEVETAGEFRDSFAPGTFTVAFEVGDAGVEEAVAVRLTSEALRAGAQLLTALPIDAGLPFTGVPERTVFDLDGDTSLVIDALAIDAEGGVLEWHVEGSANAVAAVVPQIEMYTGPGNFVAAVSGPANQQSFFDFFGSATPPPLPEASGTIELHAPTGTGVGRGIAGGEAVVRANLVMRVDWFTYADADVRVPLDDVASFAVSS